MSADDPLPSSLFDAVRTEFRRTFRMPFDAPIAVAVNATLMSSLWFLLPQSLKDSVFTLHGSLVYAVVLSAWMYADVPATNVLAADARRSLASLDDPAVMRLLLDAKSIVLWFLVTPICLIVAVVTGAMAHNYLVTFYSAIWVAIVPLGILGISGWVGVLWPYHPMPIRYRVSHRAPFRRMVVRWVVLITMPYLVVPALGVALMMPSLLLWGLATPNGLSKALPSHFVGLGVGVACVLSAVASIGGRRVSYRLIARRRARLAAFLADPTAG